MDVDYGERLPAPPTAPNAARRGAEQESIHDTPEAFLAAPEVRCGRTCEDDHRRRRESDATVAALAFRDFVACRFA